MASYPLKLTPDVAKYGRKLVWEVPVRIAHGVLAASIFVLFATGFYITYPVFTSSGEAYGNFLMGRFRQVHFIAGYALLFSFLLRSYWFFAGNKYARSGAPLVWRKSWWKNFFKQAFEYVGRVREPVHLGHSSLAGFSYFLLVGLLGGVQIVTGFAMYGETNPGGFWDSLCGWVIPLFGGSYRTHLWHHLLSWGFVIFAIIHVYIVFFDSIRYNNGLISSMISGDKFYEQGDLDNDDWVS